MAENNINGTEEVAIKKRYTVGMIIAIVFLVIAAAIAGLSVWGKIVGAAMIFGGMGSLIAGVATFLFAHFRKKNRLEALGQKSKTVKNVRKQEKVETEEKQKVEKNKQEELRISPEEEKIREANRASKIGKNTFAVTEMVKDKDKEVQIICRDHNGKEMIYNINGSNEQDIRRIIVSLTGNELKNKTDYVISIYDGNGKHNDFKMTNETFETNLMAIYKNVRTIKREYNMEKPQMQPKEPVAEEGMELNK